MRLAIASAIAALAVTAFSAACAADLHESAHARSAASLCEVRGGPLIVLLHASRSSGTMKHQTPVHPRPHRHRATCGATTFGSRRRSAYQIRTSSRISSRSERAYEAAGGRSHARLPLLGRVARGSGGAASRSCPTICFIVNRRIRRSSAAAGGSDPAQQKASTKSVFRCYAESTLSANSYEWLTSAFSGRHQGGTGREADIRRSRGVAQRHRADRRPELLPSSRRPPAAARRRPSSAAAPVPRATALIAGADAPCSVREGHGVLPANLDGLDSSC